MAKHIRRRRAAKARAAVKPRTVKAGAALAEDEVVDEAFQDNVKPIRPETAGGAPEFEPDTGREPLAGGGVRRGEALQLSEEEDDFEDGRSSAGRHSRSQEDQWARGAVGGDAATGDEEPEPPEDVEG